MNTQEILSALDKFDLRYKYNSDFARKLLAASPGVYAAYASFLPMAGYRQKAPAELLFAAKLAALLEDDCATSVQINIRMALESGVSRGIIRSVLENHAEPPEGAGPACALARRIARNQPVPDDLIGRIVAAHGDEVLAELAVGIAAARVFPALKRALGFGQGCAGVRFEV
jgi:hypothetical protein